MLGRLLELVVLLLVLRAAWRIVGSMVAISTGSRRRTVSREPSPVKLVRDPVCGVFVVPSQALTSGTGTSTRYFCSEKCRQQWGKR